jgi:hypothetical protein
MEIMRFFRLQWDRTAAVIAAVVGVIALLLGYFGISGTPHVAAQLPYIISGGLFGIFALGIASMAWISADLRDEWRELRALRQLMEEHGRPAEDVSSNGAGVVPSEPQVWSEHPTGQTGTDSMMVDSGPESHDKTTVSEARRPRTRTRPLKANPAPGDTGSSSTRRTPER